MGSCCFPRTLFIILKHGSLALGTYDDSRLTSYYFSIITMQRNQQMRGTYVKAAILGDN